MEAHLLSSMGSPAGVINLQLLALWRLPVAQLQPEHHGLPLQTRLISELLTCLHFWVGQATHSLVMSLSALKCMWYQPEGKIDASQGPNTGSAALPFQYYANLQQSR